MKRYKILSLAAAVVLLGGMASCKKSKLFTEPEFAISEADAYSSADRIDKSAVGMYDQLQNANYFGGRILVYVDQRGLDANQSSFFGEMGKYTTLTAGDGTVAGAWSGAYRTIYQANLFYQSFLPKASLVTAAKADQYIGESKFIRALCYFYLVNLWAQPYGFTADNSHLGVPLILTATNAPFDASNNVARATVKQVYDQMEADLLDAEAKLPTSYTDPFLQTARATKGAARALLARLYLYKGDYLKADTYAGLVIGMNYQLQSSLRSVLNTPYTTRESIFSVAMSGGDNPNTNNSIGQHYGINPGRGDVNITSDYLNLFAGGAASTDKRIVDLTKVFSGSSWSTKYPGLTTDFVPVIRLAEVILIKAEALARQSTTVSAPALTLVQSIRTRSDPSVTLVATTQQQLIDVILKEKRMELAFEGHNYLDLSRAKLDLPPHGFVTQNIAYGANLRVFPIPTYDLQKNPNLVPNPGY